MTEADDEPVGLDELDRLFEAVLEGRAPGPDAPAWCGDLARLVAGARAEATPAELAAEDQIVARMVELRLAGDDDLDEPDRLDDPAASTEPPAPPRLVAVGSAGAAPPPASDAPTAVSGTRARAHSPRHARSRAKHAAPKPVASGTSAARGVGRLIAFKAAAVTTAVVVGTVAAAAATTGIVTNVVVPAFTREAPGTPPVTQPTGSEGSSGGAGAAHDDDPEVTVPVPTCQLTPVCSPLTPSSPSSDQVPSRPTGPSVPTTERPRSATTTTESPTTTTESTTTTSEPDPGTTTTETTTSTTEPEPVEPFSTTEAPEP